MRKQNKKTTSIILVVFLFALLIPLMQYAQPLYQYFFTKEISLNKTDNHINILLLGIGGGKHDGPNLTDSMILVSINPKENKTTLISIPRDLWIPELRTKINGAYATGEAKQKGGGIILTDAAVSKLLDQDIDYTVRIDFTGFVKAVDLVGGLDVVVERELDDYEYPISGKENDACGHTDEEMQELATASSQLEAFPCRYKHIHFASGKQHMNGEKALEFVRSRHAQGAEGSDFARSKRQGKILSAFRQQVFSYETLLNPIKVISLYNALKENVDTNIPQSSLDDFLKLAQQMKDAKVESVVIDGELLTHPPISAEHNNAWVFIPRSGNGVYTQIQAYTSCVIDGKNCTKN